MTNREALNIIADMCNALQLHPNSRQGKAMMMAINSLKNGTPPVENKSEWIPVSERLPEKNDVYLVAVEAFGYPRRDVDGFIGQTPRKWEHYGDKVVAWMPLPEPYTAEIGVSE